MIHSTKDLFEEIDETINMLIENAKVLDDISGADFYKEEIIALEKTQESLLAHLIHMDEILKKKDKSIYQEPLSKAHLEGKLGKSGYLNKVFVKKEILKNSLEGRTLSSTCDFSKPRIHKRKASLKKEGC